MASIGQKFWQAPHFLHFVLSIWALPSMSLMAPTGQMLAHAPQPIHFFTSTILLSLLLVYITKKYMSNKIIMCRLKFWSETQIGTV